MTRFFSCCTPLIKQTKQLFSRIYSSSAPESQFLLDKMNADLLHVEIDESDVTKPSLPMHAAIYSSQYTVFEALLALASQRQGQFMPNCETDTQQRNLLFWVIERDDPKFINIMAQYPVDWLDIDQKNLERLKQIEIQKHSSCFDPIAGLLWEKHENKLLKAYDSWVHFLANRENFDVALSVNKGIALETINLYQLFWQANQLSQKDNGKISQADLATLIECGETLQLIHNQHADELEKNHAGLDSFVVLFQQQIEARVCHLQALAPTYSC